MTDAAPTLAPLGDPGTLRTLRYFEDEYEAARWADIRAWTPESWEHFNHWQRIVQGYCAAHRLTPSVAVGSLR